MRVITTGLIVSATLLGACAIDDVSESSTQQQITAANRIAVNRIAVNRIAVNRIAVNRIAVNRIAVNRIAVNSISTQELLATDDGREVFGYLVSCAMPADVTLVAKVGGATFEFPGLVGLAPRWEHRALTKKEQHWISACMIARVNNFGESLLISLRGPHEALAVSAQEAAKYTLEEGAFYGDIFVPEGEPLVLVSCRGESQARQPDAAVFGHRACARGQGSSGLSVCDTDQVTFTFAGDCADYFHPQVADPRACEGRVDEESDDSCDGDDAGATHPGGYYKRCHAQAATRRWPQPRFDEVITVFLDPNASIISDPQAPQ